MVTGSKDDFSVRLGKALDSAGYPAGRGRRVKLASDMAVSGEAVRKWLSGDSIPAMDNARKVARLLAVNVDWLLTGRPPRDYIGGGPTSARIPAAEAGEDGAANFSAMEHAVIGLLRGLTKAQQEAFFRQLQDQKHLNDELLTQLMARRKAI